MVTVVLVIAEAGTERQGAMAFLPAEVNVGGGGGLPKGKAEEKSRWVVGG